ncbi:ABC transporter substrate-binding protein [Tardisphaera miroshnichenkoae]
MRNFLKKVAAYFAVAVFLLSSLAMGGFIAPVSAQQAPQIVTTNNSTLLYSPSMPVWNVFAANNFITTNIQTSDPPLMWYDGITNSFLPALATGISEFPSNDSFILYLRKGLNWYNGSATMPFTAWDVYTYFYIEAKVFQGYSPYLNYSKIHVLNNYTIEFTLNSWAPTLPSILVQTIMSTPYKVWEPVLANVTKMNSTEAVADASNVEHFVPAPWFLGPYYDTVSVPYVVWHLDPQNLLNEWAAVYPYHTWQDYNPEVIIWWTGGNGQTMNAMLAGKVDWSQTGFSPAQFKVLESSGFQVLPMPDYSDWGILVNPADYPLNISTVRVALAYAINRTEVVDSWNAYGINLWVPWNQPGMWARYVALPDWLEKDMTNLTYDPSYAAQLLESVGFTKKNGQWYMPNGKPFTLSMQLPGGWTDVSTMFENAASQLTTFGIPTQTFADDVGTYFGTMLPDGDFELALIYWGFQKAYATSWSMGWWWWNMEYTSGNGWLTTNNYPIVYPNGTKGIFNFNNWYGQLESAAPMSAQYNQTMLQLVAFLSSQMPIIPLESKYAGIALSTGDFNTSWILKLPVYSQATIVYPGISPGMVNADSVLYWPTLFGVTPPGVQSPLAEAIATDSLSPEFAAFLGLPLSYSAHYTASALSTSKISLTVSPTTLTAGTSTTLTATVTYANGTPASGVTVDFLASGAEIGSTTTGSNGQASFTYTPTSAGTQTIVAYLAYAPSVKATPVVITVEKPTTVTPTKVYPTLSLSVSKSSVIQGSPVVLTATATFPNGTPASGYSVGFFANGAGIGSSTTGTNGQASFTYTPSTVGVETLMANLVSAPSITSNTVSLNVTAMPSTTTTTTTTTTTSNTTLYAIVAAVVVIVVVVAVVLALSRRGGKKGPQPQQQQK